jgi:hypothetical protein
MAHSSMRGAQAIRVALSALGTWRQKLARAGASGIRAWFDCRSRPRIRDNRSRAPPGTHPQAHKPMIFKNNLD